MDDIIAVDRSQWKIILVGIFTAIAGAWLGYATSQWFTATSMMATVYGLIAAIVFAILFLLQSLMIHSGRLMSMLVIVEGASLIIAGFWKIGITNATLLGGLAVVTLLVLASWRGQGYAGRTLLISVREAGVAVTPLAMTAIALVASVAVVGSLSENGLIVSRSTLEGFLKPSEWVVQRFAPGFALQGTLNDVVRASSELILKGELAAVPQSAQTELINGAVSQIQEMIRGTFAVNVRASDAVFDIIERVANAELKKIPDDLHTLVWLGIGILIFLTIKGFGALLGGIVGMIAALMYQLLTMLGFIRVGFESRQKEVVVL